MQAGRHINWVHTEVSFWVSIYQVSSFHSGYRPGKPVLAGPLHLWTLGFAARHTFTLHRASSPCAALYFPRRSFARNVACCSGDPLAEVVLLWLWICTPSVVLVLRCWDFWLLDRVGVRKGISWRLRITLPLLLGVFAAVLEVTCFGVGVIGFLCLLELLRIRV